MEGFTTEEDQEMLNRIEKQIKRRFVIGSQVSEHAIVQDFSKQKYPERAIYKVRRACSALNGQKMFECVRFFVKRVG